LHSPILRRTNIETEFTRIQENQAKNNDKKHKIQPKELLKGSVLIPLSISLGIMFFQQFTGINAMVFYTVSIFKSAGSSIDGRYATIIIGFVQLFATAASGFFVINIFIPFFVAPLCHFGRNDV
jgi:facilitated trehalose transporter